LASSAGFSAARTPAPPAKSMQKRHKKTNKPGFQYLFIFDSSEAMAVGKCDSKRAEEILLIKKLMQLIFKANKKRIHML
jgi:hypothetical protein